MAKSKSGVKSDAPVKHALFDESSGDEGASAQGISINKEFASRFEHNKKREEKQRLEEKYKAGGDSEYDSSSDETEDDDGLLATQDVDAQINATLEALRQKDPRIYNKDVRFFPATTDKGDDNIEKSKKEKPVTLQDFQRERILRGDIDNSDSEDDESSANKKSKKRKTEENVSLSYNQVQESLKHSILSEIHALGDEEEHGADSDSEETFLKPKESSRSVPSEKPPVTLTENDVANADKNPELFLSNFMQSRAWAADGSNWKAFESDDDEELEKAEDIEYAFNMRFEDPTKSNEILQTYSRDLASLTSVRRDELKGRKAQRQQEKERKEREKQERAEEKARLKRLKLEEAQEKLEKIKKAAGMSGRYFSENDLLNVLDEAWDDQKWEHVMKTRFGDAYYAESDHELSGHEDKGNDSASEAVSSDDEKSNKKKSKKSKKKNKKPTWDDDIDITDILGAEGEAEEGERKFTVDDLKSDSEDETQPKAIAPEDDSSSEDEEKGKGNNDSSDEDSSSEEEASQPIHKKRKTAKQLKKERMVAKKASKSERAKLQNLVDMHLEIESPDLLLRKQKEEQKKTASASSSSRTGFRYRETSPTSFGLSMNDILLAPSDKALKKYVGTKKLVAEWRDPDVKEADRRRLSKKSRLRRWRREVFGPAYEKSGPTYGLHELIAAQAESSGKRGGGDDDDDELHIIPTKEEDAPSTETGEKKRKRKRSRKH